MFVTEPKRKSRYDDPTLSKRTELTTY